MSTEPSASPFGGIASYYDDLVNRFGHDPRACDYGRPTSQTTKFQLLSEVTPLQGLRLLDVGCGFADYADFLQARYGEVTYVGVDISPRMVDEARQLRPGLDLRLLNILHEKSAETFDVVNANGIFYLLGAEAPELMRALIRRMFELSTVAVAFNSLSSWASVHEPSEFYADPIETLAYCRTLTPWVVLRHDYLAHDFTIYMYRDQRR
jgi:SAM-dependent methyltransferase